MNLSKLQKLARGQECQVRAVGICNRNPETTVLAHWRGIGISGAGLKAPDALAAFACSACHDFVDARRGRASRDERELAHLRAIIRTQYWLIQHGYLEWA